MKLSMLWTEALLAACSVSSSDEMPTDLVLIDRISNQVWSARPGGSVE